MHFALTVISQQPRASQLVVKNPPVNAGDIRDTGSIPGSGRPLGGGHGHPIQSSFLENPMDRGAWRAMVPGAAKSQTRLKQLSTHTCTHAQYPQGIVSKTPTDQEIYGCSRPLWKMSGYLHIAHFTSSLEFFKYLIQCKCYVNHCWHMAKSSFAF